jgi:hypothetical protein
MESSPLVVLLILRRDAAEPAFAADGGQCDHEPLRLMPRSLGGLIEAAKGKRSRTRIQSFANACSPGAIVEAHLPQVSGVP